MVTMMMITTAMMITMITMIMMITMMITTMITMMMMMTTMVKLGETTDEPEQQKQPNMSQNGYVQ